MILSDHRKHQKRKMWVKNLEVGKIVCSCLNKHSRINKIDIGKNIYDVWCQLDDGSYCNAYYCLNSPNHPWKHKDMDSDYALIRRQYE